MPVHRGREVTGVAQEPAGVAVALAGDEFIGARYVVGCDGGRSAVRKSAGIDFTGWEPGRRRRTAPDESCWPATRHTCTLRDTMADLLGMDEPRKRIAAMMSGLDIRYDLGDGTAIESHPLLGARMPDLDLDTAAGPARVYTLLHDARPVLRNLGEPGGLGAPHDRVRRVDAKGVDTWELPVVGEVPAPTAVLIRPDGHVAWVGEHSDARIDEAVSNWFGSG